MYRLSTATYLNCHGFFDDSVIANLPQSVSVKDKSVNVDAVMTKT